MTCPRCNDIRSIRGGPAISAVWRQSPRWHSRGPGFDFKREEPCRLCEGTGERELGGEG